MSKLIKVKIRIDIDDLSILIPESEALRFLPRKKKKIMKKIIGKKLVALAILNIDINYV